MKTTRFFIGLSAIISILLFEFGFYDGGVYFVFVTVCIFILNSAQKKNAQLTSKLTDAERENIKLKTDVDYWIERFNNQRKISQDHAKQAINLSVEISDLKTQLETAKANSYTEIERKRGREKYNRLYKGKKKAEDQPYTIEGKTIKQLVEENLGIEVDTQFGNAVYLCGYDKEFGNSDIHANWSPFLVGNNSENYRHTSTDDVILKQFSNILWRNTTDVISAIKKHRNIK